MSCTDRLLPLLSLVLSTLLVGGGCVEEEPSDGTDTGGIDMADTGGEIGADTGVMMDTGADTADSSDASTDAAPDTVGDTGGDAGDTSMAACSFPEPAVAGTTKTDMLANGPEHCGMAPYKWLRDAPLGEVTDWGAKREFTADLLKGVADSQGFTVPRPLEHDVTMHQYTYKTQDRGEVVEATSLVAFPKGLESEEPRDVLLVLHGTSGFNDACAPSDGIEGQGLAALFASWGYLVIAPDYIGLKASGEPTGFLHPYLVGQATAIASLDAVRALRDIPEAKRGGLCPSDDVLVFGGSQGGHAALWVDLLQPYYARELSLKGTVATVPPANLVAEVERAVDKLVNATGNTLAFLGSSSEWYGVRDRLDEVVQPPLDTELPKALETKCDPGDGVDIPNSTDDIFTKKIRTQASNGNFDKNDPWGCMAVENGLTSTRIERISDRADSYGIFYVLGEQDNLVHTPIERKSYETLCNEGMPLKYLECKGAGHVEASFFAMPEILDFLDARMAGETFQEPSSCAAPKAVTCRGTNM